MIIAFERLAPIWFACQCLVAMFDIIDKNQIIENNVDCNLVCRVTCFG